MPVNKKILTFCEKAILYRLGGLDDISYELANTVANIHYRFFDVFYHITPTDDDGFVDNKVLFDDLDLQVNIPEVYENPGAMIISSVDALQSMMEEQQLFGKKTQDLDSLTKLVGLDSKTQEYIKKSFLEFRFINAIIGYLRILQEHEQWFTHSMMMVELIIDVFKYRITKATYKTPIRRKIERKVKKNKVREIPNLIDFINAMESQKAVFRVTRKEVDETEENKFKRYIVFYHRRKK